MKISLETQHRMCEFFYRTSAPRLYALEQEELRDEGNTRKKRDNRQTTLSVEGGEDE